MKSKKALNTSEIKENEVKKVKVVRKKSPTKEMKLLPKWKKTTLGVHNQGDGQFVRKDEYLYAEEWQIPKMLIKNGAFVLVRPGKKKESISTKKAKGLRIVPAVEKDMFDILNEDGDIINENPLTKEDADSLILNPKKKEKDEKRKTS